MAITDIVPHKDGGAWGWDDNANAWVPVDPQALAGNPIANLGRGAALGFQQLQQGMQEIGQGQFDPNVQKSGEVLKLQSQAASNAAPWTTAIGMGVPEILAGGAAAVGTGGASIPLMLAGQAGSGALIGMMRPGDVSERVRSAALGAVFAAGGAGLGEAAMRGISAGLMLGKSVTEGSVEATAQGVINGVARQQNAEARAAMAGAADVGGEAAPAGRSVGAAETPGAQLDPEVALEGQMMDQADAQMGERLTKGTGEAIVENGRRVGVEPSWWAGTPKGSLARLKGAAGEFDWRKPAQEAAREGKNVEAVNRAAARAAGAALTLDPAENTFTSLDALAMASMRQTLDQGWDAVAKEMPGIGHKQFLQAVESVERPRVIGRDGVDFAKWQDKVKEDMARLSGHERQHLTGEEFMNQTKSISHMLSQDIDPLSAQKFVETQNQLYNMAEKATKADISKGPHGGDQTITGKGWAELRREEQVYQILKRPGAVDPQGNINPVSLKRALMADKKSGGFGVRREVMSDEQRDLYDAVLALAYSKSDVPATGARLVGHLGHLARGAYSSQLARTGAAGAGAAGAMNTIWGK